MILLRGSKTLIRSEIKALNSVSVRWSQEYHKADPGQSNLLLMEMVAKKFIIISQLDDGR